MLLQYWPLLFSFISLLLVLLVSLFVAYSWNIFSLFGYTLVYCIPFCLEVHSFDWTFFRTLHAASQIEHVDFVELLPQWLYFSHSPDVQSPQVLESVQGVPLVIGHNLVSTFLSDFVEVLVRNPIPLTYEGLFPKMVSIISSSLIGVVECSCSCFKATIFPT